MTGVYRPRHPERAVLYRVFLHHFERFLAGLHPHLHFLATEGEIPHIDDTRLADIFAREVLAFLVGRELLSPEWAERLLSGRHTGFSVHSP